MPIGPFGEDSLEYVKVTYARIEAMKAYKYRAEKNNSEPVSPEAVARVRRSLFGPHDHEGNARFLQEQVRQLELIEKERWGFDFKTEIPLPGYKVEMKMHRTRPKQTKLTEYLPAKKTAEAKKKLKFILDNMKDEDLEEMQVSS